MKKIYFTISASLLLGSGLLAQLTVSGPIAVSGYVNSPTTAINTGGSIQVVTGGTWELNGNITSADKGGANGPSATGRAETITFDGSGGLTANGFIINGYAATTAAQTASLVLPIGNSSTAYPVTVPAGTAVTAAYFDGSGTSQTATVSGQTTTTTEYSPYIDMPNGFAAGSYTFGYPGFPSGSNSSLLSSGNSSASGTSGSTAYSLLKNVASFSTTPSTTTATLPATMPTQVYFASSSAVLPISLTSFTGIVNGCSASLAWQTASELNSSYYGVEYSNTGSNFAQVAKVNSKNSATGASYAYSFNQLNGGNNFFRLKAVDNDGRFTYSQVITLTGNGACSAGMGITVSPNPASNLLNIQHLDGGKNQVTLFDMNGKKLTEVLATGTSQSINISKYAKGVYMLRIQNASGNISTVKVVKE